MIRNLPTSNDRLLFDLRWCEGGEDWPVIDRKELMGMLVRKLCLIPVEIDIVQEAKQLVGTGCYRLSAGTTEAPQSVDCSSFVKYLFTLMGIRLPRYSADQRGAGAPVGMDELLPGDLVFATGPQNFHADDPENGVGHVGLYAGEQTVIHASPGKPAITQVPLKEFYTGRKMRGACRILPPKQYQQVFSLKGARYDYAVDLLRQVQRKLKA